MQDVHQQDAERECDQRRVERDAEAARDGRRIAFDGELGALQRKADAAHGAYEAQRRRDPHTEP